MMKTPIAKTFIPSLFLAVFLAACSAQKEVPQAEAQVVDQHLLSQQNVDATLWYNTSAENYYIYEQTYHYATNLLEQKLSTTRPNKPGAVIMDLDETVLDNSPYMLKQIKEGTTFDDDSWALWVDKGNALLLPGAKDFIDFCNNNGLQVFFISNRSERLLDATMRNMNKYELPNIDPDHVLLKSTTSDKTERRARVLSNFDVLLYLGDNMTDFDAIFKDRSQTYGKSLVKSELPRLIGTYVLFPNPMYGGWRNVFALPEGATEDERAKAKIEQAQQLDY